MTSTNRCGSRTLNLELNGQSVEVFARLKNIYGVESDVEVIRKALALLDVAGQFVDGSGALFLGNGEKMKKITMFRE
ncbi:MAG: hypothetical protein HQL75_02225 [Magnetococcales bacterium]|nr:hypothetical protein [Magnetococcales bacterium]